MAFDIGKIEERIDKVVTGGIELNDEGSGIAIKRLIDAMEVAKLMSISGPAIPLFMQGSPGLCYACVVRAVRWGMDPFFVAEHSYLVKNPKTGEERVAYDAQLITAVINARAPLQKRLWAIYTGEGEDMRATVYALPKGQTDTLDYETPTLRELIAIKGRNEYGKVRGSPLYDADQKQALWYYGARGLCRRHFSDVLAGVYDKDEFEPVEPRDVTPERMKLSERLKSQKRITSTRGFNIDRIDNEIKAKPETSAATGHAGEDDDPAIVVSASAVSSSAAPSAQSPDGAASPSEPA